MISEMEFHETPLDGVWLIEPFCATDERGALIKDYNRTTFESYGITNPLKEEFYTVSRRGVIRANHFQAVKQQAKIVRCISGKVIDAVTDLRPDSPTFGKHVMYELSAENRLQLYVPRYCAHGYLVVEDSVVCYKADEEFYGPGDSGIMWNDPDLAIEWPLHIVGGEENLTISGKDRNLMSFQAYKEALCRAK